MSPDLASFQELVRERCGLRPDVVHTHTLAAAIRFRMEERGIRHPADYHRFLTRDAAELQAFASLLTINETYFMRECVHFELLADKLLGPMLAAQPPGTPLRILAAGCSTGEEPYSLMIALLERHGSAVSRLVSIVGVDVDAEALARAERAIYSGLSFRALPDALLGKYFEPLGGDRHRVRDSVRTSVRFLPLNLAADDYPATLGNLDAIFYRNVSIYFDKETQRRIFGRLAGLLKTGGWLFVSSTETLTHDLGLLALVEVDGVFCFRKGEDVTFEDRRGTPRACAKPPAPAASRRLPPSALLPPGAPVRASRPEFDRALALAGQKRYDEALAAIERFLAVEPSFVKGHMLHAGILVNLRRNDESRRACLAGLEREPWCLDGHLLLGLLCRIEEHDDAAVKHFRDAVYVQPSCWLAHFHLAQILSSRDEAAPARREYEVVVRLLAKDDLADHGLSYFPLAFSADHVERVSRHHLAKLGRTGR